MKTISWYDYSQVVYRGMDVPVIIGCPIHGSFKQTPYVHRMGSNCPYCTGNTIFNPKTKSEIKEYWIKNKITGSTIWYKHWKDNNLQEQGYPSVPWQLYKISNSHWIEYVWGKKKFKTKSEIKEYWIKNKITGSDTWRKHWKDNNLQEQGYLSQPWKSFRMPCIEWTEYVWGEKKTKEEVREYWIKNKITSSSVWTKHWRGSNLPARGYSSNPWSQYKMTKSEWTEYVWGKKKTKTKEEIKEYWIKNKITGYRIWHRHWQDNNLQEQGYINQPRKFFKMTCIEWTEYVWGKTK